MKKNPVKKVFLASDLCVIVAVLAVGCAFIPFGSWWSVVGYTITVCGLVMLPLYLHGYKIEGHAGIFRMESVPVARESKDEVLAFLNGDTDELHITASEQGGALVALYHHKKGGEIIAQFFDYTDVMNGVPSPMVTITPAQYDKLKSLCPRK